MTVEIVKYKQGKANIQSRYSPGLGFSYSLWYMVHEMIYHIIIIYIIIIISLLFKCTMCNCTLGQIAPCSTIWWIKTKQALDCHRERVTIMLKQQRYSQPNRELHIFWIARPIRNNNIRNNNSYLVRYVGNVYTYVGLKSICVRYNHAALRQ